VRRAALSLLLIISTALGGAAYLVWSDTAHHYGLQLLQLRLHYTAAVAFRIDRLAAHIRTGHDQYALAMFMKERADQTTPLNDEFRWLRLEYYDQAIILFESYSSTDTSKVSESRASAGLLIWLNNQFEPSPRAEKLLRESIRLRGLKNPKDPKEQSKEPYRYYLLAHFLFIRGKETRDQPALEEAILWNETLLRDMRDSKTLDPMWLEQCGDINAALQRWQIAEACYKESIVAYSQNPIDIGNLVRAKLVPILRILNKTAEADAMQAHLDNQPKPEPPFGFR
jgi:hypothetical protein